MSPTVKQLDRRYREWIRLQPSCLSGRFEEYVNGDGRSVAAHVRRAGSSGTGYKGMFACVPLTQSEHLNTHQYGDAHYRPKEWWDARVVEYRNRWIKTLPPELRQIVEGAL